MTDPVIGTISPWQPEQDRIRLAMLGKLGEECSELAGRASRCIIQGLDEADPDTGRRNSEELTREIADVLACIEVIRADMPLFIDPQRFEAKLAGFRRWHQMIAAMARHG